MTRIRDLSTSELSGSSMKSDMVSPVNAISGVEIVSVICGKKHSRKILKNF